MANYITIDGGTTNTRISLVVDGLVVDTLKYGVGARAGMTDGSLLRDTVREGITALLEKNQKKADEIERILASGMITSEFGLCPLPHTVAPAGLAELHAVMQECELKEITNIPFVFMRGVKIDGADLAGLDMMRGEETELMGLFRGAGVYVLPGSHSKIITVDEVGRITAFTTMLTGEMIAALSGHTILKDAVDLSQGSVDASYLMQGFSAADSRGLNAALFSVRILKNLLSADANACYSYFMGVVLCDEIKAILATGAKQIYVGGKKQIKEATVLLLHEVSDAAVITVSDAEVDASSALGAVRIYETV